MNNGKICISVCAETADQMIAKIKRADPLADVIEVRFDCLDPANLRRLVETLPKVNSTYLFTFRPKEQGGRREIALSERLKFWELIFYHQKTNFMIDLEDPQLLHAINPERIERIFSAHDFSGIPHDLDVTWSVLSELSGRAVKLAVSSNDCVDAIAVWKLIDKASAEEKRVIPIAMGKAGKWTRILGLAHGAYMTYASLDEGEETAAGQITAKELIDVYRVKELDENTVVYGVIGDPVSSSLSPYMHNAAFVETGINAVFLPLLVKNLDEFIRRMVAAATREAELNFAGFSVTMPHKQAIIKHLDEIDPVAEKIGAVNTVKITGGKLVGYNTDAHGFITPLKHKLSDLKNARVAVIGAGGAARACVYALTQEGAEVTVFARDLQKANSFVEEFNVKARQFTSVGSDKWLEDSFDIVVNATPLGMVGQVEDRSPLTSERLEGVKFVYDLVTRSGDTPLVAEAKKAGAATIDGVEMLVSQGLRQFEIWTGREAPAELMRQSVMARLSKEHES